MAERKSNEQAGRQSEAWMDDLIKPYTKELRRQFHPEHLKDLARSGLSEQTVLALGIHTVIPREIPKHLGFNDPRIESLLCFPYPGIDGFCRDKVFPPLQDKDGHTIRYLQRKGSGVHLYLPPLAQAVLSDPTIPLYITEGEKKAAKACQEGYPCIGLGGLWNWLRNGEPIDELNLIACQDRHLLLVPDSDAWRRQELLHPVYAFGEELKRRGGHVHALKLPQKGEEKVGMDDFLLQHDSLALKTAERFPLSSPLFSKVRALEERRQERLYIEKIQSQTSEADKTGTGDLIGEGPLPKFPEEAWTGPFLRWRESLSRHTNAPEVFMWAAFATAWGLVLGHHVLIMNPLPIYPNLWSLLIGPSARARKSTVLYALNLLLRSLQIKYTEVSGLSSIEGLAQRMKEQEHQPALLHEDEFRRLLGVSQRRVTANIIPDLQRLAYCHSPFEITRKETIRLEKPFLALMAATPLSYMEEILTEGLFTGGLLNRLLLLYGEPGLPMSRPPALTVEAIQPLAKGLQTAMEKIPKGTYQILLTPEAERIYDGWYYPLEDRLKKTPELIQTLLERLPEHTLKLSLIYATLEGELQITSRHLMPALAVMNYQEQVTRQVFGTIGLTRTVRVEEKVYRCITKGMKTAKEIKNHLGARYSMDEINHALRSLEEGGRIFPRVEKKRQSQPFKAYYPTP